MTEFKQIDDLSHPTEHVLYAEPYEPINAWVHNDALRIQYDGQAIQINTRLGAIALRDWLTKAIGDAE